MPELPEVETTRRGIAPHVTGQIIADVIVRNAALRWPAPDGLRRQLTGLTIRSVTRRAKYLLLRTADGVLMIHLGMSGSLRVVPTGLTPQAHDHIDLRLGNGACLRLRDPRRFGSVHWITGDPERHPLLRALGPEPLGPELTAEHLHRRAQGRAAPVKHFLMNNQVVVGVGNIYASESLFRAGVHPFRPAGRISLTRYDAIAQAIKAVLTAAIRHGGTTLRDFVSGEGKPGYFRNELAVYGRAGQPCVTCRTAIKLAKRGQRATYYCPRCQRV